MAGRRIMKSRVLYLVILIIAVCTYHGVSFYYKVQISKSLVENAIPYEKNDGTSSTSILVLGDSTAVGVGARSVDDTLPALLSREVNATYVENRAVSGALTRDLEVQLNDVSLNEYSYILIAIGGNDIIRFQSVRKAVSLLDNALNDLPPTRNLIVYSAGNVGASTLFPWFIRPLHTSYNQNYHEQFEKVVRAHGGKYVNFYKPKGNDPFVQQPEVYLAGDGLHPTSAGYALWFEEIRAALKNR